MKGFLKKALVVAGKLTLLTTAVSAIIATGLFFLLRPEPEITIFAHNFSSQDIAEIYIQNDNGIVTKPAINKISQRS